MIIGDSVGRYYTPRGGQSVGNLILEDVRKACTERSFGTVPVPFRMSNNGSPKPLEQRFYVTVLVLSDRNMNIEPSSIF